MEAVSDVLEFLPEAAEILNEDAKTAEVADEVSEDKGNEVDPVDEAKAGKDDGGEDADEPEESPKVQKRIDKLTARAKSAEERAAELEKEVEKLKGKPASEKVVVAPSAADPLADVETDADLENKLQQAVEVKKWAIQNPDGGTVKAADGTETEISSEQVRAMLAQAEERIALHIPRRARYLQDSKGHEEEARKAYPEMFGDGEAAKAADRLLAAWPELKRFPDWRLVLGDYMAGNKARTDRVQEVQQPSKKAEIAPPVPRVKAPQKPAASDRSMGARERAMSEGTVDAITEYFKTAA